MCADENSREEQRFRLMTIAAIKQMVAAARRYAPTGTFDITASMPDGSTWQILIRPDRLVPAAAITEPGILLFGLN